MSNAGVDSIGRLSLVLIVAVMLGGCTSYTTPKGGADMSLFARDETANVLIDESMPVPPGSTTYRTDSGRDDVIEIKKRRPTAQFPVYMLAVRVQEPGYTSHTIRGYGRGNYSVVTIRDVEKEEDFDRQGRLAGIARISMLNRLLLPNHLQSDVQLRQAASRLQADMLLIYTLDTEFYRSDVAAPLSIISLGLSPTIQVRVITTLSAVVMDTRTGYIYGTLEETARNEQVAAALTTQSAFDQLRLKTERQAFDMYLDEFEVLWKDIVNQYGL